MTSSNSEYSHDCDGPDRARSDNDHVNINDISDCIDEGESEQINDSRDDGNHSFNPSTQNDNFEATSTNQQSSGNLADTLAERAS